MAKTNMLYDGVNLDVEFYYKLADESSPETFYISSIHVKNEDITTLVDRVSLADISAKLLNQLRTYNQ